MKDNKMISDLDGSSSPIKFDFDSGREIVINVIMVIGLLILSSGYFGGYKLLIISGAIISFLMLLFMLATSDYLMFDPETKNIMSYKKFFFIKKAHIFYPFSNVKYVKLLDSKYERNSKFRGGKCTQFFVQLLFRDGKTIISRFKAIVNREDEYNFGQKIVELRDYAFKIASMVGCEIFYSEKIPFNERLQPPGVKKMLDEVNKTYEKRNTLSKDPACFGAGESSKKNNEAIHSDFTVESKIKCYNCNSPNVVPGKKFCRDCLNKM